MRPIIFRNTRPNSTGGGCAKSVSSLTLRKSIYLLSALSLVWDKTCPLPFTETLLLALRWKSQLFVLRISITCFVCGCCSFGCWTKKTARPLLEQPPLLLLHKGCIVYTTNKTVGVRASMLQRVVRHDGDNMILYSPPSCWVLNHVVSVFFSPIPFIDTFARLFSLPPTCLLYTSPSPRDKRQSRMPSSA